MRYLHLVRHGETDWNIDGRLNSSTDTKLNAIGRLECAKLEKDIRHLVPDFELWTSPLTRTSETAVILNGGTANSLRITSDAVEVSFGPFEGWSPQTQDDPELSNLYVAWNSGGQVLEAEALDAAGNRARRLFLDIQSESRKDNVVLVTHGVFIRIFLCVNVLGLSPLEYRRLVVDNASISSIQVDSQSPRLARMNWRRINSS